MTALVVVVSLLAGLQPVDAPEDHGVGVVEVINGTTWLPAGDAAQPQEPEFHPPGPLAADPYDATPQEAHSPLPAPPWPAPDTVLTPEEQIRARWAGTGDADTMVRIARRESHLRCDAANPRSSARGLFQILTSDDPGHGRRIRAMGLTVHEVATECWANIAVAWALYVESGTRPWTLTR